MAKLSQRIGSGAALPVLLLTLALTGCQRSDPGMKLTPALPLGPKPANAAAMPAKPPQVELPPEIDPGLERGQLRAYYKKNYAPEEFAAVRELVEEIFPNYTPYEKR